MITIEDSPTMVDLHFDCNILTMDYMSIIEDYYGLYGLLPWYYICKHSPEYYCNNLIINYMDYYHYITNYITMIIIGDSPTLSCLGFLHLVRFEDLLSLQDLKPTRHRLDTQTWRNRLKWTKKGAEHMALTIMWFYIYIYNFYMFFKKIFFIRFDIGFMSVLACCVFLHVWIGFILFYISW